MTKNCEDIQQELKKAEAALSVAEANEQLFERNQGLYDERCEEIRDYIADLNKQLDAYRSDYSYSESEYRSNVLGERVRS